jgi:hypothetical protein
MAIQTRLGKAFEYACLMSLNNSLCENQLIEIEQTNALTAARDFYDEFNEEEKIKLDLGANASTRIILRLEPQLQHPLANIPLILAIQEDAAGIAGDVRDVICIRRQNEWEIGISCKHNHSAVKHSRLSSFIDFGQQWLDIPCSQDYFNAINPLFTELVRMRIEGVLWREVTNKAERFYVPLLQAFINELRRLDIQNPETIPARLLQYLLGRNDFYKIITNDKKRLTQIQSFNMAGTLNRSAGTQRALINVPQINLPTRFFDINFKPRSRNTILVACDNGWTISMRIHSASSAVEPSLKFDVSLVGVPPTLYTQIEPW